MADKEKNEEEDDDDQPYFDRMQGELESLEYFHGNQLEEDVRGFLHRQGDFILRTRQPVARGGLQQGDERKEVVLSILWQNDVTNIPMQFSRGTGATFDSKTTDNSAAELMRMHLRGTPILLGSDSIMLLNPIPKCSWELKKENIGLVKKLGEGAFGEVHMGILKLRKKKPLKVAVKVIKRMDQNDSATVELQKEAAIMRQHKHRNIVQFFGMVIERHSIMVVMELVEGGGLDSYIKSRPIDNNEKGGYAFDIASGLAYLHSKKCLHRDIACRNCLLDVARKLAKLSDFGLSRQTDAYNLKPDERIPIRWIAPEVIATRVYTRAADVYAYGILVWEIFSNAALPYGALTNIQIKAGISSDEFRPAFAEGTPPDIVKAASDCWIGDPAKRANLVEIVERLKDYGATKGGNSDTSQRSSRMERHSRRGKVSQEKYNRAEITKNLKMTRDKALSKEKLPSLKKKKHKNFPGKSREKREGGMSREKREGHGKMSREKRREGSEKRSREKMVKRSMEKRRDESDKKRRDPSDKKRRDHHGKDHSNKMRRRNDGRSREKAKRHHRRDSGKEEEEED